MMNDPDENALRAALDRLAEGGMCVLNAAESHVVYKTLNRKSHLDDLAELELFRRRSREQKKYILPPPWRWRLIQYREKLVIEVVNSAKKDFSAKFEIKEVDPQFSVLCALMRRIEDSAALYGKALISNRSYLG